MQTASYGKRLVLYLRCQILLYLTGLMHGANPVASDAGAHLAA